MSGKAVLIGTAMVFTAIVATAFILRDRCEPAADPVDQYLLEAALPPRRDARARLPALQLPPGPQVAPGHALDGGRPGYHRPGLRLDRRADRRSGSEAEAAGALPPPLRFKLRHYREEGRFPILKEIGIEFPTSPVDGARFEPTMASSEDTA